LKAQFHQKSINPMILSPININPDSHSWRIWNLGNPWLSLESFGTATWLKNMVLKALGYLLTFLGKGTWLKSVVLKERLTIPDYLLDHPVRIHLVVPTANWESNHSPLSVGMTTSCGNAASGCSAVTHLRPRTLRQRSFRLLLAVTHLRQRDSAVAQLQVALR
jgi:hypothetical protein